MTARTVARLSTAPVKSMGLQHPEEVRLERYGVPGNRLFYLIDGVGRLYDAGKHGPLVRIRASYDAEREHLALAFPDGEVVEGKVSPEAQPVTTIFWGRPVAGRAVAGPWSEAVSRYLDRQVRLMRCERPGDGNDEYPASLVSTASIEELARRSGVEAVDARRFRMLVEVAGCHPHEEDTWMGRAVRVGGAVIRIAQPDPRCVVTTRNPDTGLRDFDTLRAIKAYRGVRGRAIEFGVYADVEQPGRIRVGDPVEPLDA